MPETVIPDGKTKQIYQGTARDRIYVTTDSDIKIAKDERFARKGRDVGPNNPGEAQLRENNEEIYAYANGAEATVLAFKQGFSFSLFGQRETDITAQSIGTLDTGISSFSAGTIDTDITAQSAGDITVDLNTNSLSSDLDINLAAQTQNIDMDVAAQSLTNLTSDQAKRGSLGIVEVNADDGSIVSSGTTHKTITQANSNEVWELTAWFFSWSAGGDFDGQSGDDVDILLQSEGTGIIFAQATANGVNTSDSVIYEPGVGWRGSATLTDTRDAVQEFDKIDDNTGIEVVMRNESNDDITADRSIRYKFTQVQV